MIQEKNVWAGRRTELLISVSASGWWWTGITGLMLQPLDSVMWYWTGNGPQSPVHTGKTCKPRLCNKIWFHAHWIFLAHSLSLSHSSFSFTLLFTLVLMSVYIFFSLSPHSHIQSWVCTTLFMKNSMLKSIWLTKQSYLRADRWASHVSWTRAATLWCKETQQSNSNCAELQCSDNCMCFTQKESESSCVDAAV